MHDDYPGQEKVLLIATRLSCALLVGVVLGLTITTRVVDPLALILAGLGGYLFWRLREF